MDAYNRYLNLPQYSSSHENYFADKEFTSDDLYEIVKTNNTERNYSENKQISDSDLKFVCKIIAPVLLEYGNAMSSADATLLSEKISELTIYTFSGFSAGAYDSAKSELGLDITQKNSDKFTRTIQHETHHMIQASSIIENETRNLYWRYGFSYAFSDGKDEPLNLRWITEASAELLTHNRIYSREYDVYEVQIKTINYIKVATILRSDIDDTTFEKLSLSPDIEVLFDYFGCTTDDTYNDRYRSINQILLRILD